MGKYIYKERTERNLPHFHPPGATLFVTFRLAGTVSKPTLRLYYAQKRWWEEEVALHQQESPTGQDYEVAEGLFGVGSEWSDWAQRSVLATVKL